MFSFFKKKFSSTPAPAPVEATPPAAAPQADAAAAPAPVPSPAPASAPSSTPAAGSLIGSALVAPIEIPVPSAAPPERQKWLDKLKAGLGKTASSISGVFGGSQIDEALYEDLEGALLMADTGVSATQLLTDALRKKVKATGCLLYTSPSPRD